MEIAIDIGALRTGHKVRGIGVMVDEQIKALQKQSKKEKGIKIYGVDFEKTNLNKYDVVHYPYFFPYFETLPDIFPKAKTVVTVQDLIYLVFPDKYPPGLKGRKVFKSQKNKIKNVDRIVTISKTSKKDIVKHLKVDENNINVVYLAPKEIFKPITDKNRLKRTKKKYNLPEKFVLYVGDVNYNKNIISLVKACEISNINLCIVGKQATEIEEMGLKLDTIQGPMDWIRYVFNIPHPELQHFRELKEQIKGSKIIVRTGFVSEDELVDIYNLSTTYCQPSVYEGFGFPVLEAMACGIPVIASEIEPHKEIASESAEYFDPYDSTDLSNRLSKVMKSKKYREKLIRKGDANVKRFSWEKYAKEMLNVYKKVYSENG